MKIQCRKCGLEAEHAIRSNGRPMSWCKACQREYSRQHYASNKTEHNKRRVENRKLLAIEINELLRKTKDVPCKDCNKEYPPYVMQFDHVRGIKHFNISDLKLHVSRQRLLDEIAKCEVVCANCHAIRTFFGI